MRPTTDTSSAAVPGPEAFRLPRTVEPVRYRIEVEPNVASASFSGTVSVDVVVHEPVAGMVLNAADLAISDVEIRLADASALSCAVSFVDELEQVVFRAPSALPPGPCTVSCRFSGTLNDKLRGFYRSTYTTPDGDVQTIATTQFESVDARRAFPCWDEPDRKAVFEITLVVDPDAEAFSNSPVAETTLQGAKRRVRFAPTMKMSTYLVAYVIGKLQTTETVDVDGVPLRVVCTPGKLPLADFALEIGAFALRFFSEYFNIPYPGDKVDLVAIPELRGRRHGEPRMHHVPGHRAPRQPRRGGAGRARAGGRRRGARAGPHVVRRPRHHGLVGRHLAQRGLRHLHGDPLRRCVPALVGPLALVRPRP